MMRPPGAHTRASSRTNWCLSARRERGGGGWGGQAVCVRGHTRATFGQAHCSGLDKLGQLARGGTFGSRPRQKGARMKGCTTRRTASRQRSKPCRRQAPVCVHARLPGTYPACAPRSPCSTPGQTRRRQRAAAARLQGGRDGERLASAQACWGGWGRARGMLPRLAPALTAQLRTCSFTCSDQPEPGSQKRQAVLQASV